MSKYLISRIEGSSKISLLTRTTVIALDGTSRLEHISWLDARLGVVSTRAIHYLFMMTGADPNTSWLGGQLVLDSSLFIVTGSYLEDEWPLKRAPYRLEASIPGVFAVGDMRSKGIKRVASAVREGSMAVQFVHHILSKLEL